MSIEANVMLVGDIFTDDTGETAASADGHSEEECLPPMLEKLFPGLKCARPLTAQNEETRNFMLGWQESKVGSESDMSMTQWRYHPSTQVQTLIFYGPSGRFYSSGGYLLNLRRNSQDSSIMLWKMEEARWFSRAADVIFVHVSVYNPNIDKITVVATCLEIWQTQGIDRRIRIIHLPASTNFSAWEIVEQIILGAILFAFVLYLLISITEKGTVFFNSFWNIIDFCIALLYALNYIFSLKNEMFLKFSIGTNLKAGQENFSFFGWLHYYTYMYYLLFTLLFICCSIRLFKHFMITLQVFPILITVQTAWPLIFKVMIVVVPALYLQFSVIDSLLFNSQTTANRFPLVNKVSLKNYASMYSFPENKLVPYLYCHFCSMIIVLLSVLIAHHYRIAKNGSLLCTLNTADLVVQLRDWLQWKRRTEQVKKLKGKILSKNLTRLRSGADNLDTCVKESETKTIDECLPMTSEPLEYNRRNTSLTEGMTCLYAELGRVKNENVNFTCGCINLKLDKIAKKLFYINETL